MPCLRLSDLLLLSWMKPVKSGQNLRDRFSQMNGSRIYELKKALADMEQENDSVSIYYGKLKTTWDELLNYQPIPECSCGKLKVLVDRYQRDCVIKFLMGLNDIYDNTRAQIMMMKNPFPRLKGVFIYSKRRKAETTCLKQ